MSEQLSAEERDHLRWLVLGGRSGDIAPAVERILAARTADLSARVAAVEALCAMPDETTEDTPRVFDAAIFRHTYNPWTGRCGCGEGPFGVDEHKTHVLGVIAAPSTPGAGS